MAITIQSISTINLTPAQLQQVAQLNAECFSHVDPQEAELNFIAESQARLLAYDGPELVATAQLFIRDHEFAGQSFKLGGVGGVCVTQSHRRQGLGRRLMTTALEWLKQAGCAVACLNTEPDSPAAALYAQLGFQLMPRDVAFTNARGETIYDNGTMFVPLNSAEICKLIMDSTETFHYGVGYW